MNYFIFRNYTVEPFFKDFDVTLSGYGDVSFVNEDADCYIWFYQSPIKSDSELLTSEINQYRNLFQLVFSKIKETKTVIAITMDYLFNLDFQTVDDIAPAIAAYNQTLYEIAKDNSNLKVINISHFYKQFPAKELLDWKYFYLFQIPINPKFSSSFSQWLRKELNAIEQKRKKCIVLDLDNTLWGGILGEDGSSGITMGETYPGICYRFFQETLLQLSKKGIILAICSKNNEADVWEVIDHHPEMILRKQDFVSYRINWENKAHNIKEIAEELNIGLDSIVFIDDNPSERELIIKMLPEVSVPEFPTQPYLYPVYIKEWIEQYFKVYQITSEDTQKTLQYKENVLRKKQQSLFTDFSEYLKDLQIVLEIEAINKFNVNRLAQLTQKTNQFNLTTHRYTEADIYAISESGGYVYAFKEKDKFGDNGIVGLMILKKKEENTVQIDTFLLSCRVLGKGLEFEFAKYIFAKLKREGVRKILATYRSTAKNEQVKQFYEKLGFTLISETIDTKEYYLETENTDFINSEIYQISE